MTVAAAAPATARPSGPTFLHVVRSEWTKLWSLRSTPLALLIATVLGVGLGAAISAATGSHYAHADLQTKLTWDPTSNSLDGLGIAQLAIVILGIVVVSGEYSSGAIRTTLTAVPHRTRVLAAKAVVYTAVALVLSEILAFVAFLLGQQIISGHAPDATLADPTVLRAVVGAGLYLAALALLGVAVGALLRHSAAAIASVVAILFVLPGIGQALPASWRHPIEKYWPTQAGNQVLQVYHDPNALRPWPGFLLLCLFVAVVLAIAFVLLERRDV
jgi:ABC-type transport system involved in multi-copper enzyme maturation permease subunit